MSVGIGGGLGAALIAGASQYQTSKEHYEDRAEAQKRQGYADTAFEQQQKQDAAEAGMDEVGYKNMAQTLNPHFNPVRDMGVQFKALGDAVHGRPATPPQGQAPAAAPGQMPPPQPQLPGGAVKAAPTLADQPPADPTAAPADSGSMSGGSPIASSMIEQDQTNDDYGMSDRTGGPYAPNFPIGGGNLGGNRLDVSAARHAVTDALGGGSIHGKVGPNAPLPMAPLPGQSKVTIPADPRIQAQPAQKAPALGAGPKPVLDTSKVSGDSSMFNTDSIQGNVSALADHYDQVTDEMRQKAQVAMQVQDPTVRGRLLGNLMKQYQPQLQAMQDQGQTMLDNFHTGIRREAAQNFYRAAYSGDVQGARDYLSGTLKVPPQIANTFQGIQPDKDAKGTTNGMSAVFKATDGTEHRIPAQLFHTLYDDSATPAETQAAVKDMESHLEKVGDNQMKATTQEHIAQMRAQGAAMRANKPASVVQQADAAYKSALKSGASEEDAETARFGILNNAVDARVDRKNRADAGTETDETGVGKDGKPYSKKVIKTKTPPGAVPPAPPIKSDF